MIAQEAFAERQGMACRGIDRPFRAADDKTAFNQGLEHPHHGGGAEASHSSDAADIGAFKAVLEDVIAEVSDIGRLSTALAAE